METIRRILLPNLHNLRDMGGWPVGEDKMTRWNVCYRSDIPECLTQKEIRWLLDHKITTIIDLRNDGEAERRPNCLAKDPAFHYVRFSMYEEGSITASGDPTSFDTVGEFYLDMLDSTDAPEHVLRAILEAPDACLFHCSAGKDRTGLITALLMMLAGCHKDDIIADYQVSYTYMRDTALSITKQNPDKPAYIYHSEPDFMRNFLELFNERYGTISDYMLKKNFTETEVKKLRNKIVVSLDE